MTTILSNKRIFVVEDDQNNRAIISILLEQKGSTVICEPWIRGTTMVRLLAFYPVDLILLDLMLPRGQSGLDIFAEIRRDSMFDKTPIVMVSAAEPAIAMPQAQSMGFNGYIGKPFDYDLFPQQIADVLGGKEIWAPSMI